MPSNTFNLARLRDGLKPFRLYWVPTVRSTNDYAARLRQAGELFAPAVVLTGRQTAGRGRGGNSWWSNPGVLTVTFALPIEPGCEPHELPLLAGLAVRDAAANLLGAAAGDAGGAGVSLKWPNDVYLDGRKLAGLLCERVHKIDLVGVGLNVNVGSADLPAPLRATAASLRDGVGRALDMTEVLIDVARSLRSTLRRRRDTTFRPFVADYERSHYLTGRTIRVTAAAADAVLTGRCEGIDEVGRLLLRDRGGTHRVVAGHVCVV